jgi:hypothetical protein
MQKTLKRICFTVIVLTVLSVLFALSASALVRGDIDEDKIVTPADARTALRISVNLPKSTDPLTDYSTREKDIADMDMDLTITPADARAILRTAVQLDKALPYYAYTVVTAPTCTTAGLYERISTDSTTVAADFRFMQEVPALGHDYSVLVDRKIAGTCTTPGYGTYKCVRCNLTVDKAIIVDHVWSPATCTTPKTCINCHTVNGSALGHTTMLGVCTRCGEYQGLMLDYYKTKIAPDLNEAVRALQKANSVLWDKYSNDYTNKTITIDDAKQYYITAYNHYYAAYQACGDFKEFKEAKDLLYTICYKLLEIIYTGEITQANYSTVVSEWMSTTNTILDQEKGYNAALKQVTDSYKNPDTVSPAPSGTDKTPTVPDPGTNPGGTITPAG